MSEVSQRRLRFTGIGRLYPVTATSPAQVIEDGVVCIEGEEIAWVGSRAKAPALRPEEQVIDVQGATVTPGWIDSHTHLIWAGSRQGEFRQRIEGRTYLEIAQAGGGIMSTVREVRKASLEQLLEGGRARIQRLMSYGITTAEAKSGYGLDTASELKILEAVATLHQEGPMDLVGTFLGAHTIPTEYRGDRGSYVALVCEEMIPEVQRRGLAEYCDVFVEEGAFTLEEARRILQRGLDFGLLPRVHAEQMSCGGGAALAAELGAVSADHLEEIDEASIQMLAEAGVVACLIPGSTFCLRQKKYAPAKELLQAGVTVALSTDLNPGTTCSENLAMIGTIACIQMRMTPLEVLHAVTRGAARALRREHQIGSLAPGYQADLVVFDAPDIEYLFYHYGVSHVRQVYKRGTCAWDETRDRARHSMSQESRG